AGLWETWQIPGGGELDSCTILTTTPNSFMRSIHDRMPVILEPEDFGMWLDPGERPENGLHLLRPFSPEKMNAYPVSTFVNNPRNEGSDCIAPLG
ncbi:MAG: SOS response-associated peptidase family protein, partial [Anaerolineales bacterium]|nr:SOS response-associated peptidase family protein [Anaerolineales bacterium]